jgi:hypothetical protein
MHSQISVKIRPNNQITITSGSFCKRKKKIATGIQQDLDISTSIDIQSLAEEMGAQRVVLEKLRIKLDKTSKLYLDIMQNSQRSKKPLFSRLNKPKNFTKQSGHKLKESGSAMDLACNGDPRFCHEVTLTLPGNTKEAFTALAAYSGYAINRLLQPIRRDYGSDCLWFYVLEYQKRGALHIHFALYHPDETEGLWIAAKMIEQWHKVLVDIGEKANTDMFVSKRGDRSVPRSKHQHHTQPISKSVGQYFSKYAGKQESKQNWYCQKYPVSRFWGSSKMIKEIIKEYSFEYKIDYFSDEKSQQNMMGHIIESLLEQIEIVSVSGYQFDISVSGSHKINRYSNGRKIIVSGNNLSIAKGERHTIYCAQKDYPEALKIVKELSCRL